MKYFKIGLIALLAIAFYAEGLHSGNFIMIWGGHISAVIATIYGYVKLILTRETNPLSAGRITYGIFDLGVTLGMLYYLFHISYFNKYSSTESFLLITAIITIIVGKAIYYYKKHDTSITTGGDIETSS